MKRRLVWLIAAIATGGPAAGCRDGGGGATDAGMDGGALLCPATAPAPMNQIGACCYRASNASRASMPELRIAALRINSPAPLGSTIVRAQIADSGDRERFNWLVQLSGAPTGGIGPVVIKSGLGRRNADGTFQFAIGDAPPPGAADRWDPVALTGTMDGEVFTTPRATRVVTVAMFLGS